MQRTRLIVAIVLAFVAGIAVADTDETMARNRALYERHAGAEVDEIRSWRMYDWLPLGDDAFAVWTRPNAGVYLVDVDQPCVGLDYARTIGITSTTRTVSRRFDRVKFDRQDCGIRRIRPVDFEAVRAERRAAEAEDR
ncbi:MAG TPA: DUF6491 family protein [Xanthomonadales bacterium]|nr:DUF6491 family protein [Xanthomonadales bacterium]